MSCFHRALVAVAPCVILSSHHRCDGDFGTSPRENFLVADYSISCNSPSYRGFFFPWAVMMSLVYPVGVPLLYTCLLLPHRKALEQDGFRDYDVAANAIDWRRGGSLADCRGRSIVFLGRDITAARNLIT